MGMVYADAELINGRELVKAEDGNLAEDQIRRMPVLDAVVFPGDAEPLLGAVPMQDMDVLIDRHRLIVNPDHPILAGGLLK